MRYTYARTSATAEYASGGMKSPVLTVLASDYEALVSEVTSLRAEVQQRWQWMQQVQSQLQQPQHRFSMKIRLR